ncbi:MOSC domain-containing protein [Streptomyces sp. NPDC048172]|uniref:MOSC domain-containing protein n=1 Tax=Streptomyces sp. NPDC048172 TaxID=3365505 RepID=UPI00371521B5
MTRTEWTLGTVERIWRYPIKSMGGERLHSVRVETRGLAGDRLYAVRDAQGKFGSGKNTRRFRRMDGLLRLAARYEDPGAEAAPVLLAPDGTEVPDPTPYLRAHLAREDVELAREGAISHFDQLPVSVLTTATLDWVREAVPAAVVDERRFRPNLLIRTPPGTRPFVEDDWFGRRARLGEDGPVLEFVRSSERCVMTNAPQRGLPPAPGVLRAIARAHDNRLDALARVTEPGMLSLGAELTLLPPLLPPAPPDHRN